MQLLILAGVFFGLVFLIVAIYGVVNRESLEASEAAREQLRTGERARWPPSASCATTARARSRSSTSC